MISTADDRPTAPKGSVGPNRQDEMIRENLHECEKILGPSTPNGTDFVASDDAKGDWCPAIWDKMLCWNRTRSGTLAILPCPNFVAGFDVTANASKLCMEDGQWYRNPDLEYQLWTNYSQCYNAPMATVIFDISLNENASFIEAYLPTFKTINRVGHTISLLTLIAAFLLLFVFRRLHCARITIHLHLFVSFILKAFMALLKDSLFVHGVGLPSDLLEKNGYTYFVDQFETKNWICKTLTSFWQYFIAANYSWILTEGLYIHNIILLNVFSGENDVRRYILMGWGLPVLVAVPWIVTKMTVENVYCWTTNSNPYLFLIIRIPTMVSILINFVLFVNIAHVLWVKITAPITEEAQRLRRWVRSTIVLVPVFGIHYAVFLGMSHSIRNNSNVELVWLFCDQIFASFQGFFIAVLYCFLNGEVRSEMRRFYLQCRYRTRGYIERRGKRNSRVGEIDRISRDDFYLNKGESLERNRTRDSSTTTTAC